jgi:hypothetical protein
MVVSQFQVSGLWECSSLAHLVHDPSADVPSSKTTTRWQISACILGVLCRRGNGVCWGLVGLIDRPKAILASTPLRVCMYQVAAVPGEEIGGEIGGKMGWLHTRSGTGGPSTAAPQRKRPCTFAHTSSSTRLLFLPSTAAPPDA